MASDIDDDQAFRQAENYILSRIRIKQFSSQKINTSKRSAFLSLPAELRNRLYHEVLGMNRPRVPRRRDGPGRPDSGFKLLLLCRQIYHEARSLFTETATAYVPAGPDLRVQEYPTVIAALADMKRIHFHLHYSLYHSEETHLKGLLSSVRVFTAASDASSSISQAFNRPRTAMVHLGQFLGDRPPRLLLNWDYRTVPKNQDILFHIIQTMGGDLNAAWTLHYFAFAGQRVQEFRDEQSPEREKLKDFERRDDWCKEFENIQMRVELYGDGNWEWPKSWEGKATREVTLFSKQWPNAFLGRPDY